MKRNLSILLSLMLFLSIQPMRVFAEEITVEAGKAYVVSNQTTYDNLTDAITDAAGGGHDLSR